MIQRHVVVAGILAVLAAGSVSAQTTIDTGLPPSVTNTGPLFGPADLRDGNEHYAGQIFTVPTVENILTSFGFTGTSAAGGGNPTAWLYAWSGAPTGPLLFGGPAAYATSAGVNPSLGFPGSWDYLWNVGAGGIPLTAGAQYVAFVGDAVLRDQLLDVGSDSYSGGTGVGVSVPGGSGPPATPWTQLQTDVAFRATFIGDGSSVSVPEPATVLLLLTGVLGLGFVAYRRKDGLTV